MNRENLYNDDDEEEEEEDEIGIDLEDLRRACMAPSSNSDELISKTGSIEPDNVGIPSDSENEDDFEMVKNIKSQLTSSKDVNNPPKGLSLPSDDSESDDDFELLKSIKSQLALSMNVRVNPMSLLSDDEEDDAFETLRAIRRRFSAYKHSDREVIYMNESPRKNKQVHELDNEPSLSRSNTCESFPDSDEVLQATQSSAAVTNSSLPESALAFVEAIRMNRSYQKLIRKKLGEIEKTIEENEKHIKNVKIVKDFQASCKRITKQALSQRKDPRIELISTRKSQPLDSSDEGGNEKKISPLALGPKENPSVADYKIALEKYPVSVDRRNWTAEENGNLLKGLKQQVQETLLTEAIEMEDIDNIRESIKNLEITPEMIREFLPKVNWDQLASMYLKDRSAAECEARWMSTEDPLINHGPWTAEEDTDLRLIVQGKSFTDWLDIAVQLGTNRTPFQCLTRYQRSFNAEILRREWTPEEDEQLKAAVELFGEKDWQSVANALEGRTGAQCSNRWMKTLHPTRKRIGAWSLEEDKRLKVAVTLFGAKEWNKIAKFVPGRKQNQCRERWVNSLDPKVNRGKWTKEEDDKLREAIAEHGYSSWAKVTSYLSNRTDSQCRRRWKHLYPHQVPLVREAIKRRKEAVVGNFVDRESERPALATSALLALPEIPPEPEPGTVALKKKRERKKRDAEGESEVSCSATERQPKRRRKRVESQEKESVCENDDNNGGEVMALEWHNENQDIVKEKKRRRRRKSVAETPNKSSVAINGASNENQDIIKEKQKRRRRKSVAETSNKGTVTTNCASEQSTVTTNCASDKSTVITNSVSDKSAVITNTPQVRVGLKKLQPRRKVSTIAPIEKQNDSPN